MTHRTRFFLSLVFVLSLLGIPVGGVFAAPALQNSELVNGIIQSITLEADTVTGVTFVSVDVLDADDSLQRVRVSLETAIAHGLVVLNGDGKPAINNSALGQPIEIDPSRLIPTSEENDHPIANALATFFSDLDGIDYETIMMAHEQGIGFGVIAQTLWLTTKLEGDANTFEELIQARQTGDFSSFILADGSSPQNWGQLRKAILEKDKKNGLGIVISNSNDHGNGIDNNPSNSNNGNGNNHENGTGNGNGNNGGGNGNGQGNGDNRKDKGESKDNPR